MRSTATGNKRAFHICTGGLLLAVFAFLFYSGMKLASARNGQTDSAAHYRSLRHDVSKDDPITRLAKLQKQCDEGLISNEQQDAKRAEMEPKKK